MSERKELFYKARSPDQEECYWKITPQIQPPIPNAQQSDM